MAISAKDVKKLRDMTGSGMMDCKKALAEAEGDFDKAIEILRKRGEKVAAKRGDREANEGVVIAQVNDANDYGVIVRLSSETDFVAKNDDFVAFAQKVADLALENRPADLNALNGLKMEGNLTIGEKVTEMVGKINEKISITAYEQLSAPLVAPYIHSGYRAGVLVALTKNNEAAFDAGRDVAMQVAAMKPIAVNKEGIDQATVDQELDIAMDLARQEGKPEAMLEKIGQGRLNKFYKENTLEAQAFVKSDKQTVAQYLDSVEKGLKVTDFKHVALG
ncbi:elongation factor Ts [Lewinella marina]|uniref:Elongation factor Ts n=1 Tax=Neolewinella marina TaxID=438751 RepID=A0A2G0CGI0_9BACT|nr:translation elongation factor Ts [Neolewinella marina]NJB86461.1 elongation factor Ts [Neolewinella marina]PHK99079.1 elongation factor Ts [Neolewinella marina]